MELHDLPRLSQPRLVVPVGTDSTGALEAAQQARQLAESNKIAIAELIKSLQYERDRVKAEEQGKAVNEEKQRHQWFP